MPVHPTDNPITPLLLRTEEVAERWLATFVAENPTLQPNEAQREDWRGDVVKLLRVLHELWPAPGTSLPRLLQAPVIEAIGHIGANWVLEGFLAADAARFLHSGKRALSALLPSDDAAALACLERLLESLALSTFDSHGLSRERVIQDQSLSLLELSSPVIKLWDRILLLPLVGVIDTIRARAITERLLDAIVRSEAEVTIVDVTGVPVFDTGVAGHLMKTVAAAEMLGTRVILCGISAEGAQTLVKLGVDLGSLNTRGTLRAGVTEALTLTGQRMVAAASALPGVL